MSLEEAHVTLLTWNHACGVGVRAMDDQHGILMDTMNELRLAVVRGSSREDLGRLLNLLIEFTCMHFSNEERLMEQHDFPGLQEHRTEHRRLVARIQESALRLQHGEPVGMTLLLGTLRSWFIDHIKGLDQQYGPWLNQRGVY
jgi:hemerythrin